MAGIARVHKITYYKGVISTKAKFHITLGHETVMGRISLFGYHGESEQVKTGNNFDFDQEYAYQEELTAQDGGKKGSAYTPHDEVAEPSCQFALVEFERPVTCAEHCMIIGSRFDADIHSNSCRLAFHGSLLEAIGDVKYTESILPRVKIYKNKGKRGVVERKMDDYTVICRGLFKKESKLDTFVGLKVTLSTGENGVIEGGFGQSGKFKVRVPSKYLFFFGLYLAYHAKVKSKMLRECDLLISNGPLIRTLCCTNLHHFR